MSEHGHSEGAAVMPASGLAKAADSIEAFIKPIYTWLAYVGAAALAALVLAMMWSIIGRRFFNAPLKGSTEMTQLGLVVMTFLVLGLEHMGRHEKMTVEIVVRYLPRRVQQYIAPIIYLLGICIFVIAVWQLIRLGITYQNAHQRTRNIPLQIYPFTYLAALGMFTMIPIYVAKFCRALGVLTSKPEPKAVNG
jgi:TRAP-type C4-dicarboxylate transport system permease small subunit